MAVIANLIVKVSAHTKAFSSALRRSGKRVTVFRRQIAGLASSLKVLGAGGALFGGFALLRSAEEFEQAMRRSLSVMGDVSDAMRFDMTRAAQQVAAKTTFSAREAADAYFFLASAGLDASQSIAALPAVANFAQVSISDLSSATSLLVGAQNALGMSSKNAADNLAGLVKVSDVLTRANQMADATSAQFAQALTNKSAAAARALGKTVEETVAVLMVFANQQKKAAEGGTALDIVWRDLQTKSIKNAKAWEFWNLKVFDGNEKMRNTADIIGDLEDVLGPMSDKLRRTTIMQLGFSDKSVSATQALFGFSEEIRSNQEALEKVSNTTAIAAEKMLTPFQKAWSMLKSTISVVGTLAQPLVNLFGHVMSFIVSAFQVATKAIISAVGIAVFGIQKMAEAAESVTGLDLGSKFLASRVKLFEQIVNNLFKAPKLPELGEVPRPGGGGGVTGGPGAGTGGPALSGAFVKGSVEAFSAVAQANWRDKVLKANEETAENTKDIFEIIQDPDFPNDPDREIIQRIIP